MIRLSAKTSAAAVALGIAWVYLALALVAPGCSFAHAVPSDHHQHSGTASHATFCAWACQATFDAGPISQGEMGTTWMAHIQPAPSLPLLLLSELISSLHARAPPVPARG